MIAGSKKGVPGGSARVKLLAMPFLCWTALVALAGQDTPYPTAELAALHQAVDELALQGRFAQALAKLRLLKPERVSEADFPKVEQAERRTATAAALLLETASGGIGDCPKLTRIAVKGGGKPLGRVYRQDANFVHYETLTGIRSRIARAQVETLLPLSTPESAAEVFAELKRQCGNRGLLVQSDPGKPPILKELAGRKITGTQAFDLADFCSRTGHPEFLAALFDLAVQRDPAILDKSRLIKSERLVNQLLFSITVNQIPQATYSVELLSARYRDTAAYRERVHGDRDVSEIVGVILSRKLPPPEPPGERVKLVFKREPVAAAVVPEEPKPVDAVAPPAAPPESPPDAGPPPAPLPVTARKLPDGTTPEVLDLVQRGDRAFDQAMVHLLNSDPNENPSGWAQENAKALDLFLKANVEAYLPAQNRYAADVPQPLLDRVREATLRSSLCRKRSVRK